MQWYLTPILSCVCWNIRTEMDGDFEEEVITVAILYLIIDKYLYDKVPCYNSIRRGSDFIDEVVDHANPTRCRFLFRMNPALFRSFCQTLGEYGLRHSKGVLLEEKVGIFAVIVGHGHSTRMVQEMFQHSGETIYRHFNDVLKAMLRLSKDVIKPEDPEFRQIPLHIRDNRRYYPFFQVVSLRPRFTLPWIFDNWCSIDLTKSVCGCVIFCRIALVHWMVHILGPMFPRQKELHTPTGRA